MILYLDTETRSSVDLPKAGLRRYVEGAGFAITLFAYAINDEPVRLWRVLEEPIPKELDSALNSNCTVVIHNSAFDRTVIRHAGIANISVKRIHDTMVQALMHGLPPSLGELSKYYKLKCGKLDTGTRLINLFGKPNKLNEFNTKETHPSSWEEFELYAKRDVEAMRELYKIMPSFNYPSGYDYLLWLYDQKSNDLGFLIDVDLVKSASALANELRDKANEKIKELTGGVVDTINQNAKIIAFLKNNYGYSLPNLQEQTITDAIISNDVPAEVKEILTLRLDANSSAVRKYEKILSIIPSDNRLKDTIQFGGAKTGRDTGRGMQPQNLKRPDAWLKVPEDKLDQVIQEDINLTKLGCLAVFEDNPMRILGSLVRSTIIAPEGKQLAVADLSNIEGRVLVWLANEKWKLNFFRDVDKGVEKFDNYITAYANIMGVPPESVTKPQRTIGKVLELSCGYQGGVAPIVSTLNGYGVDIEDVVSIVEKNAIGLNSFVVNYQEKLENGFTFGLDERSYRAIFYLITKWRNNHKNIKLFWANLEKTFKTSLVHIGRTIVVPNTNKLVSITSHRGFTYITLPSGRRMYYQDAMVDRTGKICFYDPGLKTHILTFGGKLSENVTSAVARDILFHAIPAVEKAGFDIVLKVHDEIIAECDMSLDHNELVRIMSTNHSWCPDIPLKAAGFTTDRYKGKD